MIDGADPERFPGLESPVPDDEEVSSALERVAAAVDAVFAAAQEMDV